MLTEHKTLQYQPEVEPAKSTFMKELLSQISHSAIELDSSYYSNEQIKNQWIGFPPCLNSDIEEAEKRLGLVLPDDYKQFMLLTNGFSFANGVDPSFCPIHDL